MLEMRPDSAADRHAVGGCSGRAVLLAVILGAVFVPARSDAGTFVPPASHPGMWVNQGGEGPTALAVEHTGVEASISGFSAEVTTKQTFINPYRKPIEAVYVFPLPERAAIMDMSIRVGERTIRRQVVARTEARTLFERYRRSGNVAALLEQERPNIFTQTVTNLMPGEKIHVQLTYSTSLRYDRGEYEVAFPMVVAPRHISGTPDGRVPSGGGRAPDTDRVPDGSKITPPVLPAGMRSGRNIDISLHIDAASKIKFLNSPTHLIRIDRSSERQVTVRLAKKDQIPNKDFVLRYRLSRSQVSFAMLSHRDSGGGYFSLIAEPPAWATSEAGGAKEVVFVVDSSASMAGAPLAAAKEFLRHGVQGLGSQDTFRVLSFNDRAREMAKKPLAKNRTNVASAMTFIEQLRPSGAGDLKAGLVAALKPSAARLRVVVFLTDALVGNENEVFEALALHMDNHTRVFPVGLGSSVNRYLIEGIAVRGRGMSEYVLLDDPPARTVNAFYERIEWPVLTHVSINWGSLPVYDVTPVAVPDLLRGMPVQVLGRYERPARGTITVTGRFAGRPVTYRMPVELAANPGSPVLARQWARARIGELERQQAKGDGRAAQKIEQLAAAYELVSRYTSFVVVDRDGESAHGRRNTIQVPVDLAHGIDHNMALGEDDDGLELKPGDEAEPEVDGDLSPGVSGEEPTAPSKAPARGEELDVITESIDGELTSGLQIGGGATLGVTDFAGGDSSAFLGRFQLHLDAPVGGHFLVGGEAVALMSFGEETVGVFGLLLEVAQRHFLHPWITPRIGLGPALSTKGDFGLGLSLGTQVGPPSVPVKLDIRYDHTQWLIEASDGGSPYRGQNLNALTLGVALDF